MKNWKQSVFFGMVAIIAFGFAFIACDDGNGKDEEQPKFREEIIILDLTHYGGWVYDDDPIWWDDTIVNEVTCSANVQGTLKASQWNGNADKLKAGIEEAYTAGNNPVKGRFRNVFNYFENLVSIPDSAVTVFPKIIIDDNADYESFKVDNAVILRFNIDYLSNATDLESKITTAITDMNSADLNSSDFPNGFWFNPDDGMIFGNTISSSLYLTIPAIIGGIQVTSISRYAFNKNDFITGVTIPDGILLSSDSVFTECRNLASVTFKGSIARDTSQNYLPFDGGNDLYAKHQEGDAGTYTTTRTGDGSDSGLFGTVVWTKQ